MEGMKTKKNVIILGDSVIKHVNDYVIERKLDKCKVFVKIFSGAKLRCLKDHMKPYLCENPDHFDLHTGINDLNSDR